MIELFRHTKLKNTYIRGRTSYLGKSADFYFAYSDIGSEKFCVVANEGLRFSVCVSSGAHTFLLTKTTKRYKNIC